MLDAFIEGLRRVNDFPDPNTELIYKLALAIRVDREDKDNDN